MRNAILVLLLAVVCNSAAAEWVKVASNKELAAYVDPDKGRWAGSKVIRWSLIDYKAVKDPATSAPYLSEKMQSEYDCEEKQSRLLYLSWHSGNMGSGEVVFSSSSNPGRIWSPVPPDSITRILWEFACGNRP